MQYFSRGLIALIVVLGLAGITYLWWQKQQMQIQAPIAAVPLPSTPPAPYPCTCASIRRCKRRMRPWVRYEYADPDLQLRSAGQKILMRMGVLHTQALKAKLRELRQRVAGRSVGR